VTLEQKQMKRREKDSQIVWEEGNSFLAAAAGSERIFTSEDNPGDVRVLKRNSTSEIRTQYLVYRV
jgi:hypothetical protein